MGIKTAGKYCNHCQKNVMAQKNTPNHLLHFFLAIFTLGLWIPIWILISVFNVGGYRCTQCGGPTG